MEWTIVGRVVGAQFWGSTLTFPTKKLAVAAMMLMRAPKTPIVKVNHSYVFILPSK